MPKLKNSNATFLSYFQTLLKIHKAAHFRNVSSGDTKSSFVHLEVWSLVDHSLPLTLWPSGDSSCPSELIWSISAGALALECLNCLSQYCLDKSLSNQLFYGLISPKRWIAWPLHNIYQNSRCAAQVFFSTLLENPINFDRDLSCSIFCTTGVTHFGPCFLQQ